MKDDRQNPEEQRQDEPELTEEELDEASGGLVIGGGPWGDFNPIDPIGRLPENPPSERGPGYVQEL